MAATQTTLRLTDTTATSAAAAALAPRAPRRLNTQSQRFQQLAADWNAMNGTDKSSWNQLAQLTANALQPQAAAARITAYSAFVAANSALLNSGLPALAAAPAVHAIPPALSPITLTAAYSVNGVSLTLIAQTPYSGPPVLLYAARPRLSGRGIYPTTPFTLIGVLNGIDTETITALYTAKYRVPSAGYQIALKLAPVSATGYRRPPVLVTALVTASPAAPLTLK